MIEFTWSDDWYIVAAVLLLPLMAGSLVAQKNPYYALVVRGILGAIAALVYALLGAADVALTEALVGTMLSITLYAIAVRSSLVMRLGITEGHLDALRQTPEIFMYFTDILQRYHLRLEEQPYPDAAELQTALIQRDVHTIIYPQPHQDGHYVVVTRIERLYELFKGDRLPENIELMYQAQPQETSVSVAQPFPQNSP
ncbi:DUF4040 domain-containing protein [Picosynechococcus sp. NKBG15041c]|uniref:DUF4040 domain-containing protein n=1 Tax=Picosynechococcus sp. NKBG15041c TaxID=1407650 RepID=UPI000426FA20|nr:DUF4040 domain-containing protein [Picosynechococcus sp. NKBG15041c]